jgi:MFS family permease
VSHAAAATGSDDLRGTSPLRWWAVALAALAIFATYYESDVIGELADLLHRQRGFSQSDIGSLNAAIYYPSVVLALVGGYMIDRFGAARMALWTAAIGLGGAVLTAIGTPSALVRMPRKRPQRAASVRPIWSSIAAGRPVSASR